MLHSYAVAVTNAVRPVSTIPSLEAKFSLLQLSDSFSLLFLYYNGHASILTELCRDCVENYATKLLNLAFGHSMAYSDNSSCKRQKVNNRQMEFVGLIQGETKTNVINNVAADRSIHDRFRFRYL